MTLPLDKLAQTINPDFLKRTQEAPFDFEGALNRIVNEISILTYMAVEDWKQTSNEPLSPVDWNNLKIHRGADDSFYDYIPGGLDVIKACVDLMEKFYGSDETPNLKSTLQQWINDWEQIYWTGDCSGFGIDLAKTLIYNHVLTTPEDGNGLYSDCKEDLEQLNSRENALLRIIDNATRDFNVLEGAWNEKRATDEQALAELEIITDTLLIARDDQTIKDSIAKKAQKILNLSWKFQQQIKHEADFS